MCNPDANSQILLPIPCNKYKGGSKSYLIVLNVGGHIVQKAELWSANLFQPLDLFQS